MEDRLAIYLVNAKDFTPRDFDFERKKSEKKRMSSLPNFSLEETDNEILNGFKRARYLLLLLPPPPLSTSRRKGVNFVKKRMRSVKYSIILLQINQHLSRGTGCNKSETKRGATRFNKTSSRNRIVAASLATEAFHRRSSSNRAGYQWYKTTFG